MKKIIVMTMVVLAGVGLAANSQAAAGIASSGHDLSAVAGVGEICIPCHAPHNADVNTTTAPLWNHLPSAVGTTYTMYAGTGTYDAKSKDGTSTTPKGVSKLCLSCHDGTTALDAFIGHTSNTVKITGTANLGTTLTNSHPISFLYNEALVTADTATAGAVVGLNSPAGAEIKAWLGSAGEFECSSCHDVHNKLGLGAMLNKSNAKSALCLTCHAK